MDSSLKYIRLDYEGHRDLLIQRIRSRWPDGWNDFQAGNFGRIFIDLVAWSTSTLAYVVNRVAAELYIPTMSLRESAVRIGALTGYKLRNPTASVVMCSAYATSPVAYDTVISKGTSIAVTTVDGSVVYFEVSRDYTINSGATSPRRLVCTISPTATGQSDIQSTLVLTSGSIYADLSDTTLDLDQYFSAGQSIEISGSTFRIVNITSAPGATGLNRIQLDSKWSGSSGQSSASIVDARIELVQGQSQTQTITAPPSDTSGFVVILEKTPVIWQSTSVKVNSEEWSRTGNLFTQESLDKSYEEKPLPDGRTAIVFGDGRFGMALPSSSLIQVSYRTGGGIAGNVSAGSVQSSVTARNSSGQVSIEVTNKFDAGQGGLDEETLSEARKNIPRHTRSNSRCVTLSDYEIESVLFSGANGSISHARAAKASYANPLEANGVVVYAWSTGTGGALVSASSALRLDLQNYLSARAVGTDYVTVKPGIARPAPIAVRIKTFQGSDAASARSAVLSALEGVVSAAKFGETINFSDLVRAADSSPNVDSVDVAAPVGDLVPSNSYELFTIPSESTTYRLGMTQVEGTTYKAVLPFRIRSAWPLKMTVSGEPVTILPGLKIGQAEIVGSPTVHGLAYVLRGLASLAYPPTSPGQVYIATDTRKILRAVLAPGSSASSPSYVWQDAQTAGNYIDLATGELFLTFTEVPTEVEVSLTTVATYESARRVPIAVFYTGDTSATKRAEVRAAIQAWFSDLSVGSPVYLQQISTIPASVSNISTLVASISGISAVNKVVGGNSSSTTRIDCASSDVLVCGSISINGFTD